MLLTTRDLIHEFRRAGLYAGQVVMIHTSLKAFGCTIVGAEQAVIDALMAVITPEGTLVMPTHSTDNTDPATWFSTDIPPGQWDIVRQEMPPYRPESTPTNRMGRINECFRNYPGVVRSGHPAFSFAAWGKQAEFVTADQGLNNSVAEESPTGRVYDLDGWVCLLGVGHTNNTSLHLAEYRAQWQGKIREENASAVLVEGERQWVHYYDESVESGDFEQIGAAFEAEMGAVTVSQIGKATVRVMRQRRLVDYAVSWMEANRPGSLGRGGKDAEGRKEKD